MKKRCSFEKLNILYAEEAMGELVLDRSICWGSDDPSYIPTILNVCSSSGGQTPLLDALNFQSDQHPQQRPDFQKRSTPI